MGKLIVTIARQYGSGGKTIGQMLAENLGVNCYNREILRMASDDSGIKEELFNQADENFAIIRSLEIPQESTKAG